MSYSTICIRSVSQYISSIFFISFANFRPNVRQASLFSFLFGQDLSQVFNFYFLCFFVLSDFLKITTDQINPSLLDRAYQLHNNICELLLSVYESLQDFYEKMIQHLPPNEQKPILSKDLSYLKIFSSERFFFHSRSSKMPSKIKNSL